MYRLNLHKMLQRSLYAGVFVFLVACQPQKESSNLASDDDANAVELSQQNSTLPPLLTLNELLNASDFQNGIKKAVLEKDNVSLADWQQQLLDVADQVHLSVRDLNRISGEQGLMFIEFEAKKQLFHEAFVDKFMHFEDIDDLIKQYPHLTGLHERALKLIGERDSAVTRAAQLLSQDGLQGDAMEEARAQWKDFMINSGKLQQLQK